MTQQPEEQFYRTTRTEILRWLPFLHLFRAFRLAIDPRKMLLGGMAAVLLAVGQWGLDQSPLAPPQPADVAPSAMDWPWQHEIVEHGLPSRSFGTLLVDPLGTVSASLGQGLQLLSPLRTIIDPGRRLFMRGNSWPDVAYAWTQLLYGLAVWSLFGGAIARMAAVQFARQRGPSLREAVGYAGRKFGAAFSAPLLPLVFIGLFWLGCFVVGLIGRIPSVGEAAAGVLWFVPLVCGIALAVILLVIAAGWPLMVCTISVEGTDGFDGLSRAYDYLLSRPWYALSLALLALAYGSVLLVFVTGVATLGTELAAWGVSSGMPDAAVDGLMSGGPGTLESSRAPVAGVETSLVGRTAVTFWLQLLALLLWGFVYSFFWSSATIIYFLLRKSADAMPLDRVFLPAAAAGQDLPLVGIPAAEREERERRADESRAAEADGTSTPQSGADAANE